MRQAYLLTGDVAAAQDLVQEVMLRAWSEWDSVRLHDFPERWCRTVLHRLAIARWRRLGMLRRHRVQPNAAIRSTPAVEHLDVLTALKGLPAKQRRALVLHELVGLSVAEVAEEMGAVEGTVRSWLSRSRAQLTRELGLTSPTDPPGA